MMVAGKFPPGDGVVDDDQGEVCDDGIRSMGTLAPVPVMQLSVQSPARGRVVSLMV